MMVLSSYCTTCSTRKSDFLSSNLPSFPLGKGVLSLLERSPEPDLDAEIVLCYKSDCVEVAVNQPKREGLGLLTNTIFKLDCH